MNARVANLLSELQPVAGAAMLTGTSFAAGQLSAQTTHLFVTVEGDDAKMTVDGSNPSTAPAAHTLPKGSNLTLSKNAFLAATWSAAVVASQWTVG